jgi:predicted cobalt transporter CbtA
VIWIDILAILILVAMNALAKTPEAETAKETKESGEPFHEQDSQRELAASQPESEFS